MTTQEIEALKAERDALAAQVERLQYYITKYQELGAEFILTEAITKTPRQCLRDVQAEAGVKGLRRGVALASGGDISLDSILVKIWSDGYAESVRQGTA